MRRVVYSLAAFGIIAGCDSAVPSPDPGPEDSETPLSLTYVDSRELTEQVRSEAIRHAVYRDVTIAHVVEPVPDLAARFETDPVIRIQLSPTTTITIHGSYESSWMGSAYRGPYTVDSEEGAEPSGWVDLIVLPNGDVTGSVQMDRLDYISGYSIDPIEGTGLSAVTYVDPNDPEVRAFNREMQSATFPEPGEVRP